MIRRVTLNSESGAPSLVKPWIDALNDPRTVTEKAGFLLKAFLEGNSLELAVSPCQIHGERLHHYDMSLRKEDPCTLIGSVSATGIFTLLFKPGKKGLTDEQNAACRRVMRAFARLLLEQGYRGGGQLCEVTRSVLDEIGLSPATGTLAELGPAGSSAKPQSE